MYDQHSNTTFEHNSLLADTLKQQSTCYIMPSKKRKVSKRIPMADSSSENTNRATKALQSLNLLTLSTLISWKSCWHHLTRYPQIQTQMPVYGPSRNCHTLKKGTFFIASHFYLFIYLFTFLISSM